MAQDALSRKLKSLHEMGFIKSFKGSNAFKSITHLMFADDILIFSNGSVSTVKVIGKLFKDYQLVSGQMVNYQKSSFVCSKYIVGSRKRAIKFWLKIPFANLPFNYLGVPLFKGMVKSIYFSKLYDKITQRINNWKSKLLSPADKLVLINSVLSSIPLYSMACIKVPNNILSKIQKCMADFFWNNRDNKRLHRCSWKALCFPIEEGGLGIKYLEMVIKAFHIKIVMNYIKNDNIFYNF